MTKLKFKVNDLRPIIEHASNAKLFEIDFIHLADKKYWKPGVKKPKDGFVKADDVDQSKIEPHLSLVKDQGIYLMSGGDPAQWTDETKKQRVVAYAAGYHPDVDNDWYQNARAAVGGDDFSECISLEMFKRALTVATDQNKTYIVLQLTKTKISLALA